MNLISQIGLQDSSLRILFQVRNNPFKSLMYASFPYSNCFRNAFIPPKNFFLNQLVQHSTTAPFLYSDRHLHSHWPVG